MIGIGNKMFLGVLIAYVLEYQEKQVELRWRHLLASSWKGFSTLVL